MNRISKLFAMSALTLLSLSAGCGDNGNGPSGPGPYNAFTLDLYDYAHLENGYFYELWVANSSTKLAASPALEWVPLSEFNVNPVEGNDSPDITTTITGQVIPDNTISDLSIDFDKNDTVMITIEAPGSSSGLPSSTVTGACHIPADFSQQAITPFGFPVDVDSSLGSGNSFTFATPTDADTSNELSGVWFAQHIYDLPIQSLNLKHSPSGWKYEGWVWHESTWLSTGKFADAGQSDDFSGYSAGPGIGFPGEDFLNNAPAGVTFPWVLGQGDSVLITLEPSPDPATGPFVVRLHGIGLQDDRPAGASTQLTSPVERMPSGSMTFKRTEEL